MYYSGMILSCFTQTSKYLTSVDGWTLLSNMAFHMVFQMALMDQVICTLRDDLNCVLESLCEEVILPVVKR